MPFLSVLGDILLKLPEQIRSPISRRPQVSGAHPPTSLHEDISTGLDEEARVKPAQIKMGKINRLGEGRSQRSIRAS